MHYDIAVCAGGIKHMIRIAALCLWMFAVTFMCNTIYAQESPTAGPKSPKAAVAVSQRDLDRQMAECMKELKEIVRDAEVSLKKVEGASAKHKVDVKADKAGPWGRREGKKSDEESAAKAEMAFAKKAAEESVAKAKARVGKEFAGKAKLKAAKEAEEKSAAKAAKLAEQKAAKESAGKAKLAAARQAEEEARSQAKLQAAKKAAEESVAEAKLRAAKKAAEEPAVKPPVKPSVPVKKPVSPDSPRVVVPVVPALAVQTPSVSAQVSSAQAPAVADQISALYNDAVELFWDGRYSEAKPRFEQIQKLSPEYARTSHYLERLKAKMAKGTG